MIAGIFDPLSAVLGVAWGALFGWLGHRYYLRKQFIERDVAARIWASDDVTPACGVPIETLVQSFRTEEFDPSCLTKRKR